MEKRCIYCGRTIENVGDVCSHCGKSNDVKTMTVKDIHVLHQNAHNNITKYHDKKNSGLVLLVTGAILLIVGLLFLFLSFKFNTKRERVFRPATVEFVVCCVCLAISAFELSFGTVRLTKSLLKIRFYEKVIKNTKIVK